MSSATTAKWEGDHLVINWFGIEAKSFDAGARWVNGRLIFEGLSESKGWKLAAKPTAEVALALIHAWQRG